MDIDSGVLQAGRVPAAELSLDISQIVVRARGGEPVDTRFEGEELALKYSDLGMSAELMRKAIARAAAMVGIVLEPEEFEASRAVDQPPAEAADIAHPRAGGERGEPRPAEPALLDDAISAALDAELADLVLTDGPGEESGELVPAGISHEERALVELANVRAESWRSPVAALRRVLRF